MTNIKRVMTLGFFDGVHIGHAALLNRTAELAERIGAEPSVLSFDVHPDNLVFGGQIALINSAAGREELIRRLFGINNIVFMHFSSTVMRMPWRDFIDSITEQLNICHIVIGHDFSCGYKGAGKAGMIKEYCLEKGLGCDVIPPVMLDGRVVSSTYIRELLLAGRVEEANRYLGHPHTLTDTVHSGYHLGTKMGTPTINMRIPEGVIVPRYGVYAARAYLEDGGSYIAVTNVGVRPTVSDDGSVSVESHLLDYSGNLYGRQARLEFYSFVRPEKKFASSGELFEQIWHDAQTVKEYFEKSA